MSEATVTQERVKSRYHFDGVGLAVALLPHLDLTPTERLVLVYVGGACGRKYRSFEFFQSVATVAQALGVGDRSVNRAISALEEKGVLERVGTWRRSVVRYRVRLNELCQEFGVPHWGAGEGDGPVEGGSQEATQTSASLSPTPDTAPTTSASLSPTSVNTADNQMQYQMHPPSPPSVVHPPIRGASDSSLDGGGSPPPGRSSSEEPEGFGAIWGTYPKQANKASARMAYVRAVQRIEAAGGDGPAVLLDSLERRLPEWAFKERRWIPNLASWLDSEPENDNDYKFGPGWRKVADEPRERWEHEDGRVAYRPLDSDQLFDVDEDGFAHFGGPESALPEAWR